jgi:hypothetical protein
MDDEIWFIICKSQRHWSRGFGLQTFRIFAILHPVFSADGGFGQLLAVTCSCSGFLRWVLGRRKHEFGFLGELLGELPPRNHYGGLEFVSVVLVSVFP